MQTRCLLSCIIAATLGTASLVMAEVVNGTRSEPVNMSVANANPTGSHGGGGFFGSVADAALNGTLPNDGTFRLEAHTDHILHEERLGVLTVFWVDRTDSHEIYCTVPSPSLGDVLSVNQNGQMTVHAFLDPAATPDCYWNNVSEPVLIDISGTPKDGGPTEWQHCNGGGVNGDGNTYRSNFRTETFDEKLSGTLDGLPVYNDPQLSAIVATRRMVGVP